MSNRPTIYSQEQGRSFDILHGWRDQLIGLGNVWESTHGNSAGSLYKFDASPTGPASLTINLSYGLIYAQAPVDATPWGALGSDATQIMQQGFAAAQQLTFNTGGLSPGQSQWALVQCAFAQVDVIRTGDPTGGVLPYYNTANPASPLQGPNDSGAIQDTERSAVASISILYGSPVSSPTPPVPPNPSGGNVPMYLVLLTQGQTQITQILPAGPDVYAGYPYAPFTPGLIGSTAFNPSGSHHGGIAGQASQIDATKELKNIVRFANLPVTNSAPPAVALPNITVGGAIPVITGGIVDPQGVVAGQLDDLYVNVLTSILFYCQSAGSAGTAVWAPTGGHITQPVTTTPVAPAAGSRTLVLRAGSNIVNIPDAANMPNSVTTIKNNDTSSKTINAFAGQSIEQQASVDLGPGESMQLEYVAAVGAIITG